MLGFIIQRVLQAAPRHAGDVGARLRRRLRDRQSDRRADLARRDAGHPRRRRSPATASTGRSASSISSSSATSSARRSRPLLRVRHAGAAAHPAAGCRRRSSSRSSPCSPRRSIGVPLGIYAGYRPDSAGLEDHHGRLDPRLLGADLLDRADPDPDLRRASRLAAGRQPRRDAQLLRRRVELPDPRRLEAPGPAGAQPRRCSSSP